MKNVLVLTNGMLDSDFAKTCHGLLRGSSKFNVIGIIDKNHVGKDPSFAIKKSTALNIPIEKSIPDFLKKFNLSIDYAIIGIAVPGGQLPLSLEKDLRSALNNGIGIINGLHTRLSEKEKFVQLATKNNVNIIDIREPKPIDELSFWTGKVMDIPIPIIAVLGMDCAVGKRTTCKILVDNLIQSGIKAEMIYTGQTGWMHGSKYGFILDSTLNDFVSGELERAIIDCYRFAKPEIILIEGQSSLRNPSGPCGSELLLSGNAKGVILQHVPGRRFYEDTNIPLGSVYDEIKLIELYGSEVLAITLSEENCSNQEVLTYQNEIQSNTNIKTVRPLVDGVKDIIPLLRKVIEESASGRT